MPKEPEEGGAIMIDFEKATILELFEYAKNSISDVRKDDVFLIKDLFRGIDWNVIKIGKRRQLGILMNAFELGEGSDLIKKEGKNHQNQTRYRKLK